MQSAFIGVSDSCSIRHTKRENQFGYILFLLLVYPPPHSKHTHTFLENKKFRQLRTAREFSSSLPSRNATLLVLIENS